MIIKVYEVSCDNCGQCLNHYFDNKPNNKELKEDGFVVINNKHFCNKECYEDFKAKIK